MIHGTNGLHNSIENAQGAERAATSATPERSRGALQSSNSKAIESQGSATTKQAAGRKETDPAKLAKLAQAAEEFESLLLVHLLRTARESGSGGWLGSGEGHGMSSTMELAEAQLARDMAQSGALGITKLLVDRLAPHSTREADVPQSSPQEGVAEDGSGGGGR